MAGDELGPIVYRGRREICRAVGIPEKEITLYVKNYGLPAFRIDGRGNWKARPESLQRWVSEMEGRFIGGDPGADDGE